MGSSTSRSNEEPLKMKLRKVLCVNGTQVLFAFFLLLFRSLKLFQNKINVLNMKKYFFHISF